jgi:hypothetical protein
MQQVHDKPAGFLRRGTAVQLEVTGVRTLWVLRGFE